MLANFAERGIALADVGRFDEKLMAVDADRIKSSLSSCVEHEVFTVVTRDVRPLLEAAGETFTFLPAPQ